MKTSERELKQVFRDYVLSNPGTGKKDCPRSQEIWNLFAGKSSGKLKARLVDHITSCSFCLREFEAFLEISRVQGNLINEVQSRFINQPTKARFSLAWRYITAVFVLTAALAAVIITTNWFGFMKSPEERGRLSGQIRLLAPGQKPVPQLPLFFKWEPKAGAEYYVIEIFDDSLRPLWNSPHLPGVSYELPASVKEKLEKRRSYFWMLTAFSQGGAIAESSLEEFQLSE